MSSDPHPPPFRPSAFWFARAGTITGQSLGFGIQVSGFEKGREGRLDQAPVREVALLYFLILSLVLILLLMATPSACLPLVEVGRFA